MRKEGGDSSYGLPRSETLSSKEAIECEAHGFRSEESEGISEAGKEVRGMGGVAAGTDKAAELGTPGGCD